MAGGLLVDGFDVANLGVTVDRGLQGWRDGLERAWSRQVRPGRSAAIELTSDPAVQPRQVLVEAWQSAADVATLRSNLDELLARFDRADEVQVVFDDVPGRYLKARLDGRLRVPPMAPDLSSPKHRLQIPLVGRDPRWYEDTEQQVSVGSGSGDVAIPLGNARVEPTIEVDQTSFTLTYKDSGGNVVATLEVSGASAQPVTVDMLAQTITSSNGSELDARVSGTRFFALDPRDGDYATSTWPTLAVSAGTATVTYEKTYH